MMSDVISPKKIKYSIVDNRMSLTCAEDRLILSPRIFVNDKWQEISIATGNPIISSFGLKIIWFAEKQGNFVTLRAELINISCCLP